MTYRWEHLIDAAWPRFVAKVDARDPCGCWMWTGAPTHGKGNTAPYGKFHVGMIGGVAIKVQAHVFAAAAAGEAVPGQHRDHFVCSETLCVNMVHLEGVTARENSLRRWKTTPTLRRAT